MQNYHVLIVDDEEDYSTTVAERLQMRGINAQTATNGEIALKMIKENPPQVIVLDIVMPGIGGIEILQRINEQNLHIPVILLTGYGSADQTMEGMKLGAIDYLMKPCDLDVLIGKIQDAVKKS